MLYGSFEKHLTTMLNICSQCCDVLDLKKRANFPHFQQPSHEFTSTSSPYTTNERSSFSIPATKSLKIFPSLVMRMRNEVDWKYRPMPWVFFDYDCKLFGAPAKHKTHRAKRNPTRLDLLPPLSTLSSSSLQKKNTVLLSYSDSRVFEKKVKFPVNFNFFSRFSFASFFRSLVRFMAACLYVLHNKIKEK